MGASHDGAEAGLGEARTGQHLLDRNKRKIIEIIDSLD